MKYIFFGTPEFAAIVLEKLISASYIPEAVVCNPDEPIGRKKILTPPPVKIRIMNYNESGVGNEIKIFQPATKTELLVINRELSAKRPDLSIIAAYGKIIPKATLDIPKFGTINIHGSLLPRYRGASPIQSSILNGDKETGVTIMEVDEEMDHGNIISNVKIQISGDDTFESLSRKLAILGAELLIKVIPDYISGKIKPVAQNHLEATYVKIVKKEDGKIIWSKSAEEIERMARAFYPWPLAWTIWNGRILKIFEAGVSDGNGKEIGEVFLKNNGLAVRCGKGILIIRKLQLEGGKILSAREFLNGRKNFIGAVLDR